MDASLGVVVRVCGATPVESKEEPAATRWPLSCPTHVLVAMTSPTFAEDEGKVGLGWGTVRAALPGDANTPWGLPPDSWCVLSSESVKNSGPNAVSDLTQCLQPTCEAGTL